MEKNLTSESWKKTRAAKNKSVNISAVLIAHKDVIICFLSVINIALADVLFMKYEKSMRERFFFTKRYTPCIFLYNERDIIN